MPFRNKNRKDKHLDKESAMNQPMPQSPYHQDALAYPSSDTDMDYPSSPRMDRDAFSDNLLSASTSSYPSLDSDDESEDGWSDDSGRTSDSEVVESLNKKAMQNAKPPVRSDVRAKAANLSNPPLSSDFDELDDDEDEDSDEDFSDSALGVPTYMKKRVSKSSIEDARQEERPPSPPASPTQSPKEQVSEFKVEPTQYIGYRGIDSSRPAKPRYVPPKGDTPDPNEDPAAYYGYEQEPDDYGPKQGQDGSNHDGSNRDGSNNDSSHHDEGYVPRDDEFVNKCYQEDHGYAQCFDDDEGGIPPEYGAQGYNPDQDSDSGGPQYMLGDDPDSPRRYQQAPPSPVRDDLKVYHAEYPDEDPESSGHHHFPHGDSLTFTSTQKRDRRTMTWLIIFLGCTLVALAALAGGLVGALFVGKDDGSTDNTSDVPSPAPNPAPAPAPVPTPTSPTKPAVASTATVPPTNTPTAAPTASGTHSGPTNPATTKSPSTQAPTEKAPVTDPTPTQAPVTGPAPDPTQAPVTGPAPDPTQAPVISPGNETTRPGCTETIGFGGEKIIVCEPTIAPQPTTSPPAQGGPTPTSPPDDLITDPELFALIKTASFDEGAAIKTEGTPQNRAYKWLQNTDPLVAGQRRRKLEGLSEDRKVQRYILAVFYFSTEGGSWNRGDLWLTGEGECTWYTDAVGGLNCDTNNRMTILEFNDNNIQGTLPAELAFLTSLLKIQIENTGAGMTGSVPGHLAALSLMDTFKLRGHSFTEPLPDDLFSSWSSATSIDLYSSNITGPIPASIGALVGATSINLGFNRFSGPIPTQVGNMASILQFQLSGNELTGNIPTEIGQIATVKGLYLADNKLEGEIPTELGNLVSLKAGLDLSNNDLIGGIPDVFANAPQMKMFKVNGNNLTGSVPEGFGDLKNLREFRIDGNQMAGEVSAFVCGALNINPAESYADCDEIICECCKFCCTDIACTEQ